MGCYNVLVNRFSSAAGGAFWPITIRGLSLGPFSSIGGGVHRPLTTLSFPFLPALSFPLYFIFLSLGLSLHRPWCLPASHHPVFFSSSLPKLSLSTSLSFPLVNCANGAPGRSLFHCSVSGPHRGGQLSSPRCFGGMVGAGFKNALLLWVENPELDGRLCCTCSFHFLLLSVLWRR